MQIAIWQWSAGECWRSVWVCACVCIWGVGGKVGCQRGGIPTLFNAWFLLERVHLLQGRHAHQSGQGQASVTTTPLKQKLKYQPVAAGLLSFLSYHAFHPQRKLTFRPQFPKILAAFDPLPLRFTMKLSGKFVRQELLPVTESLIPIRNTSFTQWTNFCPNFLQWLKQKSFWELLQAKPKDTDDTNSQNSTNNTACIHLSFYRFKTKTNVKVHLLCAFYTKGAP